MTYKVREAEEARYGGRNDWEQVSGPVSMADRTGGFVTTCEKCGKEYEVHYGERTLNSNNSTCHTPFHPEYDYLCWYCAEEANENGEYVLPDPRGWEDRIVSWTPGNTYHGSDAYGEVLREDEPDCRGNVLVYLVAPASLADGTPHGDRFSVMPYDALELVAPEDEPDYDDDPCVF